MEFRQLELFLVVIEEASVTRAAEKNHLSPGAVSLQMHSLADHLQTELFIRRGKHLVPTPAALRLAEQARTVLIQMRQIEHEFSGDPLTDKRPFHFATGASASALAFARMGHQCSLSAWPSSTPVPVTAMLFCSKA